MAGLAIGLPAYNLSAVHKEEEKFFQLLRNDIYFAQSEAYRTGIQVSVIFQPQNAKYEVVQDLRRPMLSRPIPVSVVMKKTNLTSITYWSNGTVLDSGTLRFATSTGEKKIIVHLGKGRVVFSG